MTKAWRIVWQLPNRIWLEWRNAWLNGGQMISLGLAVLTSYIGLQTASLPKIVEEAEGWSQAIQATIYVAAAWLLICAVRAPFLIWRDDSMLGIWHGDRFVYRRKQLVATFRCRATGHAQKFPVRFSHTAPNAFVNYEIEVGNGSVPAHLYSASLVGGMVLTSMLTPGSGAARGGTRIGPQMDATLLMAMKPEAISQTVRVYCLDFSIGNPDDQDGEEGQRWGRIA